MEDTPKKPDEEILLASLDNPALFGMLVDTYEKPFLRVAYNVVRSREEAEDIVQEAFCDIYRNATKFQKQEGASFKSWAYRVLINKAISHYRKLKRERERYTSLEPEHYENLGTPEILSRDLDARLMTEKLLKQLPENLRAVMKAYYFDDKSYAQIAEEEGIPLSTLKMRLFRAKRLLRDFVGDANI